MGKSMIKKALMFLKKKTMVPVIQTVPDQKLLDGKIALITGGSGGIGKAIAQKFLDAGAKVIIMGTNEQKLIKICNEFKTDRIRSIAFNLTKIEEIGEAVRRAAAQYKDGRIDILVNCAGITSKEGFFETTESTYDQVMDLNVKSTYFMCKATAELMIEKGTKGHILNVSSSSALRPAWTPYQMSKWAIRGFTVGLADTLLPYGIIVNAIGPGQTATQMLGADSSESIDNPSVLCGRYAMPEEIANLALFMVSGAGDLIIGETYYITGGSGTISMHK